MRLLVDTHTLLWWLDGSSRLGKRSRATISRTDAQVWVSAATAWEIAIKADLGRLDLGEPPEVCIPRECDRAGFQFLPVTAVHALAVRALPPYHADPFDRLLIAQAQWENLTIVTADAIFRRYSIPTLDAGL